MTESAANAGAIKATVDFDAAGLESAVNKAMQRATGQIEGAIDRSMNDVQSTMKSGFRRVGAGILGFLGVGDVLTGLRNIGGWVMKLGDETESQLNNFRAVSGATAEQMERVSDVASQLGNDISLPGTSAADAAEAMTELAKAGFSVDQSMVAAKGTLQLATAAQIDAGDAALIASKQLQAFGLGVDKAGYVADVLANAANATSADMHGMADSLNQVGAIAHASGISFAETSAAVALMADNAIVGSDAGTSLKAMLLALQAPSGKAAETMEDIGFSAYDSSGKMKSLSQITADLTKGTKGLTDQQKQQALATIFGSDAIRTVNVLMNQGAGEVDKMVKSLERQGAAAKLAAANSRGLVGSVAALQSTAESVAIEIYDKAAPAVDHWLREGLDKLPGALEAASTYLGQLGDGLAPAAQLVGQFISAASPGAIVAFKVALAAVLGVVQTLGAVLGPVADLIEDNEGAFRSIVSAVVAATIAYKLMNAAVTKAQAAYTSPRWGAAVSNVRSLSGSLKSASTVVSGFRTASKNMLAAVGGPWGLALAGASVAIGIFATKHAEASAHIEELVDTLHTETGALTKTSRAAIAAALEKEGLLKIADGLKISLSALTDAASGNADSIRDLADGYVEAALHSERLDSSEKALIQSLRNEGKTSMEIFDQVKDHSATRADSMLTDYYRLIEGVRSEGNAVGQARAEWDRKSRAVEEGSKSNREAAGSTKELGDQAVVAGTSFEKEADSADHATRAIKKLNDEAISGIEAQISFEDASDSLRQTIKELSPAAIKSGHALDLNYQAGRDVYGAFIDLLHATEGVKGGMGRARDQIYNTIRPMVDSKATADRLTNQFFQLSDAARNVPNDVGIKVHADGVAATISALSSIIPVAGSVLSAVAAATQAAHNMPHVHHRGHAGGGAVYGAGTGTSDSLLRRLSNGEHVFTAKEVTAAGGQEQIYAMRAALRRGGLPAVAEMAGGGGSLVDNLSVTVGTKDDLPEALGEVNFHLRKIRGGSRY